MTRPRIAIPVSVQFSLRYLLRSGLIERMSEYAQPIVLPRWHDAELWHDLEAAGAEVALLPDTTFDRSYARLRRQIDLWHEPRIQSPSVPLDARRMAAQTPAATRLRSAARDLLFRAKVRLPGEVERLLRVERQAVWQHTNIHEHAALVEQIRPDVVYSLTPYFKYDQLLLRIGAEAGMPLVTSILSFDNLTTRGWLPVTFDAYLLWNAHNERELRRIYPEAASSSATVVGAPQFDFYYDSSYLWDEKRWRATLGLPPDRPVILYGAGHSLIVPHEPHWIAQLDEAVERGELPGKPVILFRRHPNDPAERWAEVLGRAKHVIADDPWVQGEKRVEFANIRRVDIERLASTLAHSAVHVNASSTMTIDGAIFDRPQIGPAYDDRPGGKFDRIVKELYQREHFLPIVQSGGLDVVTSREAMIAAIRDGLEHPERKTAERRQMVREIATFTDGRATERVSDALRAFLSAAPKRAAAKTVR